MASIIAEALRALEVPAPTVPDLTPDAHDPTAGHARRRALRSVPGGEQARPTVAIDEALTMIRSAITAYLADPTPGHMLLIAAPAGLGKTTLAVETAEYQAAAGRRVMYVGPRKEFYQDVLALAQRPAYWQAWQGRHSGDAYGMGATCRWTPQINAWMQRGYEARTFCANPRICGYRYMHERCAFYAQAEDAAPILFCQYEHVALGHTLMDRMQLIIGDELPLRAFLHPWTIPTHAIVPPAMEPGPLETMLRALRTLSTIPAEDGKPREGEALLAVLGGAAHVLQVTEQAALPLEAIAYEPELRTAASAEDAPYFHLPALVSLLRREAERSAAGEGAIPRVRVTSEGLTLLLRRTPATLPPHVIWLDATADARMYEALFGRPVQTVAPQLALTGTIRQVWAGLNNKTALTGASAKREHVRQQIDRILSRGYQRPAFISYKALIGELAADGAPVAHFGGARGTNRLQDCDALIIVGAPQPTQQAMLDIAAMVYQERDTPFDTIWSAIDQPYAGQPWAWPIGGFWNDPQLQTLLEQFRDAELVQAIHRARPLRRAVDVWLLTNVPLAGLPVELVSLQELFDAPAGVDPYRWPEVVALGEQRIAAVGMVTSAELVSANLCERTASQAYIRALGAQFGWPVVLAPATGRGRPPLACVKDYQTSNNTATPIDI